MTKKEPTYQVVLDTLAIFPLYLAFLITVEVLKIYMQQFWHAITKIKDSLSYQFKLDKKKCKVDVEVFLDILQICPRLPNQEFVIPPSSDPEIVSFIKEIRTFSAIINRCLSGKTTGLDKIKLSRAQILWGIFHNNNVDYVKLLWEDFIFQIDNRNTSAARKENMPYPRFTKAIIQHFIYKDKSISIRNRQSMHTVQDDSILGSLKFVSKTEEYQMYGALIPAGMTNRKMRDSTAYKTYLAFATRAATPKKARQYKKPASPSKKKTLVIVEEPVKKTAKKPTARRQSAGVQIRDTPAALLEEAQLKKAIKRSKRETNIHQAGGSGDGVGLELKVPDEPKGKSINTSEGTGLKPRVPDVSKAYSSKNDEEYDHINKEMYDDVNVNLKDVEPIDEGKGNEEMNDAEKATTTAAPARVASSSRSVSSNYGSIFLNLDNISSVETKIISMLDVQVQHENLRSVLKQVYSDLSISSEDNYCDTTDYAIHDENLGSTITEYEEKLMDELEWGHDVSRLKPVATHICTNECPHATNTTTNDVIVNDPNKGKAIVDTEPAIVETHINDFTHDESSSLCVLLQVLQ
ncbi:hypothetical protein Tco_1474767 [Tanacetum coccineum]